MNRSYYLTDSIRTFSFYFSFASFSTSIPGHAMDITATESIAKILPVKYILASKFTPPKPIVYCLFWGDSSFVANLMLVLSFLSGNRLAWEELLFYNYSCFWMYRFWVCIFSFVSFSWCQMLVSGYMILLAPCHLHVYVCVCTCVHVRARENIKKCFPKSHDQFVCTIT